MITCPSCASENPDGQKFCGECGASLVVAARGLGEERKVVTSLFCDLVGFTATSETADPEDVDRMLAAYFAAARLEIEAHGGTVEKFVGDAVVGVFGVPTTHEDDPERAVRAGLRIVEVAEDLTSVDGSPLRLRVGINTGEGLVRIGVVPGSGEGFMIGDAVNTASRLQSIAPEMGVAVGLSTYLATEKIFAYEELEPAVVKGKSEPVQVFWAKEPRARFGADIARTRDTPFVGREIDLALLRGIFEKTLASTSPHLVTVVGEPGIGKSRIVAELGDDIDERPQMITWRQGRCLPYGEGITFWALGEVLKAHAGILESDDPTTADEKLRDVLPEGDEREWFRQRLLPLLGIEGSRSAEREELYTAWRRFLEHIAERQPLVVVFEDLHWADPALLEFLRHLAERAQGVPMLVVGTARPELFERAPGYGTGLRNATTISLDPLSADETDRLLSALLDSGEVPPDLRTPILDRAGGNPLYAEEYVRLLQDEGLLVSDGTRWRLREGADIPFPDTVQALIAARLDTLPPERKAMLADAAVVGKVFWAGAVASMGDRDEGAVLDALRALADKELVRPARRTSMEGESEFAFSHVLARDVAYAQIPRTARASRHVAAAEWIASKAPDRLEDLAEVLAHHYSSALELQRAAGVTDTAALEADAFRYLTLSGERSLGLDTPAAVDAFQRALDLLSPDDERRAAALVRLAEAEIESGRHADAVDVLEGVIATFRDRGDVVAQAGAMHLLSEVYRRMNDPMAGDVRREALTLLEPLPPGAELVDALTDVAADAILEGHIEEGLALAERAIAITMDGRIGGGGRALGCRGMARCALGDRRGLDDYRNAIARLIEEGQGDEATAAFNNFGVDLRNLEGPVASLEALDGGLALAEARGLESRALSIQTSMLSSLLAAGRIIEAATAAEQVGHRSDAAGDRYTITEIRAVQALALVYLDRAEEARSAFEPVIEIAINSGSIDDLVFGQGVAAIVAEAAGDDGVPTLLEFESVEGLEEAAELAPFLTAIVRTAIALGEPAIGERLVSRTAPTYPFLDHARVAAGAALAEAQGDLERAGDGYADAAARWERFGVLPEQGFALLGLARVQLEGGRPQEAATTLTRAVGLFDGCGMTSASAEAARLLASAPTPSA